MKLEEVFQKFSQMNFLVIGDLMVDCYIRGHIERVSVEAPIPIVKVSSQDYHLGGAGNVALNLLALGAGSTICSVVGSDDDGRRLIHEIKELGLPENGILQSENRVSTVKTRVISGSQQVFRYDSEITDPIKAAEEKSLLEIIKTAMPNVEAVIFEDYDKGTITKNIISETIGEAKKHNKPVIVDPKIKNFLNYQGVTLFKPNLKEIREGLRIDLPHYDLQSIIKATNEVKSRLNCEGVLATLSARGIFIDYKEEKHHIPSHVRTIADISGAGDTVVSVAALALVAGLSPKSIAALANLGGGIACESVGVNPISKEQLFEEAQQYLGEDI
ncbi:MAG TPA: bifunctional ADP-heptose synthase [Cyclobacteriaceae bacterium]|jgi:rfaE bifunctional protein kinase chain/domain